MGIGKLSLGQALFKSVKSTHTLHFPLFFLTTTGLDIHSGKSASRIAPALSNFWTSSSTAIAFSGDVRRGFCLIGLKVGFACSL
ncbi:hypothetical protein LguiA_011506 [Lonicera macranthoides]